MRRVIKIGVATAATAALIISGSAASAQLDSADTEVTFTLASGPLTITAPLAAVLVQSAAGEPTVSGSVPLVTVTDLRIGTPGWTTSAAINDFVALVGGTPEDTVANDNVDYTPTSIVAVGVITANSGTVALSGVQNVVWTTAVSPLLTRTATWTANLEVDVSTATSLSPYTSTLTHSVA